MVTRVTARAGWVAAAVALIVLAQSGIASAGSVAHAKRLSDSCLIGKWVAHPSGIPIEWFGERVILHYGGGDITRINDSGAISVDYDTSRHIEGDVDGAEMKGRIRGIEYGTIAVLSPSDRSHGYGALHIEGGAWSPGSFSRLSWNGFTQRRTLHKAGNSTQAYYCTAHTLVFFNRKANVQASYHRLSYTP